MIEGLTQLSPVERGKALVAGHEKPESLTALKRLVLTVASEATAEADFEPEGPPGAVFHIAEVATLTGRALIDAPERVQIAGQVLSWTHDAGRAVEKGPEHTLVGARMLKKLGFDDKVVTFAYAHHRWGLGIPVFGNGNYPERARQALIEGKEDVLFKEIVNNFGIEALVVLLADNSKMLTRPGSYEPSIVPFTEDLGLQLIQAQIDRKRYEAGSAKHRTELIGMRFLSRAIPFIENELGIRYNPDTIMAAQAEWLRVRPEIVALWQKITYDQSHDSKKP